MASGNSREFTTVRVITAWLIHGEHNDGSSNANQSKSKSKNKHKCEEIKIDTKKRIAPVGSVSFSVCVQMNELFLYALKHFKQINISKSVEENTTKRIDKHKTILLWT